MLREIVESVGKPKDFKIGLPRPASKKHTVMKDGALISVNDKDYQIEIDGKPMVYVSGHYGIEWDSQWSWADFDKKSGTKIEKMVKYLKEI